MALTTIQARCRIAAVDGKGAVTVAKTMPKAKRATKTGKVIVVDTSILFAEPQPYSIDELQAVGQTFIIPAAVVAELDRLLQRPDKRDRARAAINVLKGFVERGACVQEVSCGDGLVLRIARADELGEHPLLDPSIADDNIIATCLAIRASRDEPVLATADFSMHVKARTHSIESVFIERYAEASQSIPRRERVEFTTRWKRLEIADSLWAVCRRAQTFLESRLAMRILNPVRETNEPKHVADIIAQFDHLGKVWAGAVDLYSVFMAVFNLAPPLHPDYRVITLTVPGTPWRLGVTFAEQQPSHRAESEEERALRIRAVERAHQRREEYLMDEIVVKMEAVREHILAQVGEETADLM